MTTATNHPTTNITGFPPVPAEAHLRASGKYFELLAQALSEPGIVSAAYQRFHRFSLGNQSLAAMQLLQRGMSLSPIASYTHWKSLGRSIRKGERALALFVPVTIKKREQDAETDQVFTWFKLASRWFSLEQTEGPEYDEPLIIPAWNSEQALEQLHITEKSFAMVNGNVQGYAQKRTIAINPLAEFPHKTRFHELGHVVLGHTTENDCWDIETLPQQVQEAEAEGVAFILCALLGLPGLEESRGYIQSWLTGTALPEKSAQRIFTAAQTIMEAGRPQL